MFWRIIATIGAGTFALGALDVWSADCPKVAFGGGGRSVTYSCVSASSADGMSPTAAGLLMMLGAAAMLGLAWGPIIWQNRKAAGAPYGGVYGGFASSAQSSSPLSDPSEASGAGTNESGLNMSDNDIMGSFTAQTLQIPPVPVEISWGSADTSGGGIRVAVASRGDEIVRLIANPNKVALHGAGYLTIADLRYRVTDDLAAADQLISDVLTTCGDPRVAADLDAKRSGPDDEHAVHDAPTSDDVAEDGPSSNDDPNLSEGRQQAIARLRELKTLHDEGILTDDEYDAKRKAFVDLI